MYLTKHTNYPCKECIKEGRATDFDMETFNKGKLYYKAMDYNLEVYRVLREQILFHEDSLENEATGN